MTPKYDGIRALVSMDEVVSRWLKRIRNRFIRMHILEGLQHWPVDGEIVCYRDDGTMYDFHSTQSRVMSYGGRPAFKFHVFDTWNIQDDYQGRVGWLFRNVPLNGPFHSVVLPEWAFTLEEVRKIHQEHLDLGYEGSIGRDPTSPYKNGRSAPKQGWMWKLKPFADEEALVIGWTPLLRNQNDPIINALGLQERSKRIDGMVEDPNAFGALICWNEKWGEFKVGGGFTDLQRCNPDQYMNQVITFKYQPNHSRDKPHSATFKSIFILQ